MPATECELRMLQRRRRFCSCIAATAATAAALTLFSLLVRVAIFIPWQQQQQQLQLQQQRRIPQTLIIGAKKCGTRALLKFLDLHPSVCAAQSEIHFFDNAANRQQGLQWYRSRMPLSAEGQVTIEKSPAYFITRSVPPLVRAVNASMRLLLIVRDPVTRVVSDFAQVSHSRRQRGLPPKSLEQFVLRRRGGVNDRSRMVSASIYHRHLRRWLQHFPPSQIHVVDGEQLVRQPHVELQLIEQFLQLPAHIRQQHFVFNATKGFYCSRQLQSTEVSCLGSGKGRRHPPVSPLTEAKLRQFFDEHDLRFASLVGRKFSWMPQ